MVAPVVSGTVCVSGLLGAVQKERDWLPADLFQGGSKKAGVVTLDEELVDRIGDSEGHGFGCDREDRDTAEPALKAIRADAVPDLGSKPRPKGGKRILINSHWLLGRGTEGSFQWNGKSGGGVQ
jgi:hypothetical protein